MTSVLITTTPGRSSAAREMIGEFQPIPSTTLMSVSCSRRAARAPRSRRISSTRTTSITVGSREAAGPCRGSGWRRATGCPWSCQPSGFPGDPYRIDPVAGTGLPDDLGDVIAYRAEREIEPAGDFADRCAVGGEAQDLEFPVRQGGLPARQCGDRDPLVNDPLAGDESPDGLDQYVRGHVLDQEARRPGVPAGWEDDGFPGIDQDEHGAAPHGGSQFGDDRKRMVDHMIAVD